jgi:methylmalonyl-CoA/ethylmalonyl-CoA epimerase
MAPPIRLKKIDHVAVCVSDVDAALARWRDVLGLVPAAREVVASQKTEAVLLPIGEGEDAASLELISPRGNDSLERFLEKRGPGLHHVAIEIEGLDQALALLRTLGVPLIDQAARVGARGHRVAFVHPKATGGVLVELVEPAPTVPGEREAGPTAPGEGPGGPTVPGDGEAGPTTPGEGAPAPTTPGEGAPAPDAGSPAAKG